MVGTLTAAAIAALIGTPHCLGMCGGFAAAAGRSLPELVAWHLGKLLTYMVLGALAGAVGQALPVPFWIVSVIAGVFLVWFAAALAGLVPEPVVLLPGLARLGVKTASRSGVPARFLFGVVNGLLPCGLLYAILGYAVAAGGWWQGALVLGVFGVLTMPGLTAAAYGLRMLLQRQRWMRYVLAASVLISGGASLVWRALAA